MKIIGVEFRVGVHGGSFGAKVAELFLHPVDIAVPEELTYSISPNHPSVSVTVHTSIGDATMLQDLPVRQTPDEFYKRPISRADWDAIARDFVRSLGGP